MNEKRLKPRIVFPLVEAGLGHIMPMMAVLEVFEKRYGDKVEIVKTRFFQDQNNEAMKKVELNLINEVKMHNKFLGRGNLQFALLDTFGSKTSMKFLMENCYKCCLIPALNYVKDLDCDLIFNTHFASLYYSCEARDRKMGQFEVVAYCPDPILGNQWDRRTDKVCISSSLGVNDAILKKGFNKSQLFEVPFLIRPKVQEMKLDRKYYREMLNLPKDDFLILLADGAYGAGKLEKTVNKLLKSKQKMTIVAVCGKNEKLYQTFLNYKDVAENISFYPVGFTDKMLEYSASCDLFVGKAGASNLAEPTYFGSPSIVTYCATPIEKWICHHYEKVVKSTQKIHNTNKVVKECEKFAKDRDSYIKYEKACEAYRDSSGAEKLAEFLYLDLISAYEKKQSLKK